MVALLLMAVACHMLFGAVRVVTSAGKLPVHHCACVFGASRPLRAGEIQNITPAISMQPGRKAHRNLKVLTRVGNTISAGSAIPEKPHAEWLASDNARGDLDEVNLISGEDSTGH